MPTYPCRSAAVCVALLGSVAATAAEPITLQERFTPGYQYEVRMRSDLSGTLTPPATKDRPNPIALDLRGDSAFEYTERVLAVEQGQVTRSARYYQRMELKRTVADKPQENKLRLDVRRLIVLRNKGLKAPFSPDGPLLWSEIDLMRADVFTPALAGMLPPRAVKEGDAWSPTSTAIQELTGIDRIEDGQVECKLETIGRQARVVFTGVVKGATEDGPNRHQIQGYFLFELSSNHISYLYLKGVQSLLDGSGKEVGRNEGRFVLERNLQATCPQISDEGLRGLALEPTADNTLLLYDNPTLGVRFVYPRRWWPSGVRGKQVTLDSADGHGVMLTLEPLDRVPTGEQFMAESRKWLQDKKARLVRIDPPAAVPGAPGMEHFALEAEMGAQKFLMDYHVLRQANGGATLATRLLPADQDSARKEVERIARSLVITRKQ
jgi:hypothetical protein